MYRYYSTQRPVGPGTCPKMTGMEVVNFDSQKWCPDGNCFAWGYIDYPIELLPKEPEKYELKPVTVLTKAQGSLYVTEKGAKRVAVGMYDDNVSTVDILSAVKDVVDSCKNTDELLIADNIFHAFTSLRLSHVSNLSDDD